MNATPEKVPAAPAPINQLVASSDRRASSEQYLPRVMAELETCDGCNKVVLRSELTTVRCFGLVCSRCCGQLCDEGIGA